MAAKKKTAKKSPAKKTKKVAAPKKSARAKAPPAKRMNAEERLRLLKVPPEYTELVSNTVEAWNTSGRGLRVTGQTPAKLKSLLRGAQVAADREEKVRRQYEEKLGQLSDARLVAQHEAWKGLLDVYAAIRASRGNEGLQEAFAFLTDHFARNGRKPDAPAPVEPAPEPTPA